MPNNSLENQKAEALHVKWTKLNDFLIEMLTGLRDCNIRKLAVVFPSNKVKTILLVINCIRLIFPSVRV